MSEPGAAPRHPRRELLLASLFFLAVTVVMTWPLATRLGNGMTDIWDGKLNLRILHWDWYQTLHDPLELFQLPIFHPARDALAFSENLYGAAVFGFPLLSAGASPVANYNALLLLGMFLSAVCAWALARHVTGDPLASIAAGLIYAFLPWRISQLPHLQYQWGAFLCLFLLFLLRYLERGRPGDLALYASLFAWNLLTNIHYGIFAAILVVTVAAVGSAWTPPRRAAVALVAMAMAVAACAPFLIPYVRVSKTHGARRGLSEVLFYSGRWTDFLAAGGGNRMYGKLLARWEAAEGYFFPGLVAPVLAGAAFVILRRPRLDRPAPTALPRGRLRLARILDVLILLAAVLAIASWRSGGLRLGPVSVGDPGRVVVALTLLLVVRLAAALPRRRTWATLGDWLRGSFRDPRAALFMVIGIVGIVVALGARTPYYTFLFQSFGFVFRAIRAPARGIVLFQLALAVLAAWGLSLWTRARPRRAAAVAAALALLIVEFRAFPLELHPVDPETPAVYRWLATLRGPSAVVEWPLGLDYDFDYLFRQTAHEVPIVNGYSGFFPAQYDALEHLVQQAPIPDAVWDAMGRLGASFLVYHAHDTRGIQPIRFGDALERAVYSGRLEVLRRFPHEGGGDYVFAAAVSPLRGRIVDGATESPDAVRAAFADELAGLRRAIMRVAPPQGAIHLPAEGQRVAPGFWVFGWAVDDSGIAEVRVATEAGAVGPAALNQKWPGLREAFPGYPGTERGGFGFPLPDLPPGPHTLIVTLVARDGGTTVLRRGVVVEAAIRPPQ